MKLAQVILLILGILCLTFFAANIETWNWSWEMQSGFKSSVVHSKGSDRLFPLVYALICFAWLLGIVMRQIWAWYLGCGLLILLIVNALVFRGLLGLRGAGSIREGFWLLFWQGLFAFILFLILKMWWIPKRKHFAR
jgi:hypothetical protein